MKKLFIALSVSILLAASSCGGGGGGEPFFGGVWKGTLSTTKNTCDTPSDNFNVIITVNQLEGTIAVEIENRSLAGYVIDKKSFTSSVEESRRCSYPDDSPAPSMSKVKLTLRFDNIDGDRASATYTGEAGPCISESTGRPGSWQGCKSEWRGAVNR